MTPLFPESLCNGPQPAWNSDRPRRPVNGLPAPATVLAVASLDSPANTPGPTDSMLKPKSQRKYNVEQLDHNDQQRPPPPFDIVYHGNCIDIMAAMPPESVDFILTPCCWQLRAVVVLTFWLDGIRLRTAVPSQRKQRKRKLY
jgi:hypothetical protein